MIYLSDEDIAGLGGQWEAVSAYMRKGAQLLHTGDFAQPVKPYLRYGNPKNRIIAMPAYAGGAIDTAGIKWIASYPDNIHKGLDRAHSVTILNQSGTGIPFCIINTNRISAIRTAGVTAMVIQEYLRRKRSGQGSIKLGMTGFGPIGRTHLDMCASLFPDLIERVRIFDLKPIDPLLAAGPLSDKITIVDSWQKAYEEADIFMTCTVSSERYIHLPPKRGSLHCNVSLRDYTPEAMLRMSRILVDDWEEICRQNTDIECLHLQGGLEPEAAFSFTTHTLEQMFEGLAEDDTVMFNPMGMAVFDICTAKLFYEKALETGSYRQIPDGKSYYIFNTPELLQHIPQTERIYM